MGRELAEHLGEPHHGVALEGKANRGARGLELRPAQRLDANAGDPGLQGGDEGATVQVARGLAGGNENAGSYAGTPRSEVARNSRKRSTSGSAGRSILARSIAWAKLKSELKKKR